jgi:hypothetical protein
LIEDGKADDVVLFSAVAYAGKIRDAAAVLVVTNIEIVKVIVDITALVSFTHGITL